MGKAGKGGILETNMGADLPFAFSPPGTNKTMSSSDRFLLNM